MVEITAQDICMAKRRAVIAALGDIRRSSCEFGKPNPLNPSVVFTGCPACTKEAAMGTTPDDAEKDMAKFMSGLSVRSQSVGKGQ